MNIFDLCELKPNVYYLSEENTSKELLISFSCIDCAGRFNFFKTFSDLGTNFLCISYEGKNAWYSQGLPYLAIKLDDALIKLCQIIKRYCEEKEIKRIIFSGSSMGGFPALLCGHFCNLEFKTANIVAECIVFGVETQLFLYGSNSFKTNSKNNFKDSFPKKYVDICHLKYYFDRLLLYVGEESLVDVYCALKFMNKQKEIYGKDIEVVSCNSCGHRISEYLNQNRGYIRDVFLDFMGGSYFIIREGHCSRKVNYETILPLLGAHDLCSDEYLNNLLKAIEEYPSWGAYIESNRGLL